MPTNTMHLRADCSPGGESKDKDMASPEGNTYRATAGPITGNFQRLQFSSTGERAEVQIAVGPAHELKEEFLEVRKGRRQSQEIQLGTTPRVVTGILQDENAN